MLPGANHSRFMARSGYDWILVDTEHGNIAGKPLPFSLRNWNWAENNED